MRAMKCLFALLVAAAFTMAAAPARKKSVAKAVKKAAPSAKKMTANETERRIEAILSTKEARGARWGIHVIHQSTRRLVFARNIEEHFAPASNTKLFTTAMALTRLGPDHRFTTTIRAARKVEPDGRLRSDLRLVGGGDPTLSGRVYPYRKNGDANDPLEPIEQLAEQVVRSGVKEIDGDIIGDDRFYPYSPYPEGWTIDDAIWEYGAPVSAIVFNDNAFTVTVKPGSSVGDAARVTVQPPVLPLVIDNRVITVDGESSPVVFFRAPGSHQIRVDGKVGRTSRGRGELLAVDDPALYAATVLYDVLTRRGIRIAGVPTSVHRNNVSEFFDPNAGFELARRVSPPLTEVARVVNKVSQNLHAEILLREVARVRGGEPTREAGIKELYAFLKSIGVDEGDCHFEDGSGLSRRTLITPRSVTALLSFMGTGPSAALWESMLPIGAEDGTLANRFDKTPAANAIHAKTGTLANVVALGGYATTHKGQRLIFSIIANNQTGPTSGIRRAVDRIGLALLDWEGN
ncbi:MAG: D-alanyl-D-alanine carboxypeptidase/D-alanyl-D-alanine-endopeptidase [Acidobacteria bacterium]|nr:D-alanyl-D-alanine carboxypeptidase/D-alanyl-D-alanine-endopeptidase [Acidobacteriota bacterium]